MVYMNSDAYAEWPSVVRSSSRRKSLACSRVTSIYIIVYVYIDDDISTVCLLRKQHQLQKNLLAIVASQPFYKTLVAKRRGAKLAKRAERSTFATLRVKILSLHYHET